MQVGLFARTRTTLVTLAAGAVMVSLPALSFAQAPYGDFGQGARQPARSVDRATQAIYSAPAGPAMAGQSSYLDANGRPMVVQTQYGDPNGCYGGCGSCGGGCNSCNAGSYGGCDGGGCQGGCYGGGCNDPYCGGGFTGSMPMGYGGTDPAVGYDLMNDVGMSGNLTDQRGPHYFDVRAEAVWLRRDVTFEHDIEFTSLNVGNTVVLNTKELDARDQTGFRVIGRYDIAPLAVVEIAYTGIFDYEDRATVIDPTGNLYSLFSRPAPELGLFGTSPVGVNVIGGANPESERALQHTIKARSDLQSAEISYRQYWLGYSPRISGTLLAGFRYTRLDDDFLFQTFGSEPATAQPLGPNAGLRYSEQCDNNLAGFQTGAEGWVSLFQGLRVGSEGKVGIYNNHSILTNRISTTPPGTTPPALVEKFRDDNVALLTEASVDVVADILPSVSLRAGYEILYMNQLVLAGNNFNEVSPYGNQGERVPFVDNDGHLFYHGAHVGFEYIW